MQLKICTLRERVKLARKVARVKSKRKIKKLGIAKKHNNRFEILLFHKNIEFSTNYKYKKHIN